MAMGLCIPDLIKAGRLTKERGEEAMALYDDLVAQYEGRYGRQAAEAMATEKALAAMESTALHRRRHVLKQALAQKSIMANALKFDGGKAGVPTGEAMMAHLVRDERANFANVEYRWKRIKEQSLGMMYDILQQHRASITGKLRNKAELADIVRELFGQDTGNVNAKELADAWRQTGEFLRQRFNSAGGHIGKLEGWGLPQSHDSLAVGSLAPEQWIDTIWPMLDRGRMIDDTTMMPFSDGKLRLVLRDVYETIVTEGWNKRTPGGMGRPSLGNRHADHRFLHFKSADDWLSYNAQFGGGDPFASMLNHVEYMSRDVAMMEILGPNPAATVKWMKDVVAKQVNTAGPVAKAMQGVKQATKTFLLGSDRQRQLRGLASAETGIDRVFNEISGQNNRAVNRNLALFGATLRNWQVSTKLGGAAITSLSDMGTQALTRAYNGLPVANEFGQYLKQLNPADPETRAFIRRAGIIGDEFAGRANQGGRMHMDEVFGMGMNKDAGAISNGLEASAEMSRRLADGVLRVSGLNALTVAGRETMAYEFFNSLATYSARDFGQLEPAFARFLQRYGIGQAGWDKIRASSRTQWRDADWILPDDIEDVGLRDRLMEGILTEIDFAIPTGGLRQRAMVNSLQRGTPLGEALRWGFQFKMFPLTVMSMHGQRLMAQADLANKAKYGVAFLGVTTLTGAVTYAMSEMLKGKDPPTMRDGDFWWRAMLKGGGLGIYGDLIEGARGQYGQDIGDIVKGPSWSTAQNIADLVQKGDVARFMRRETPGGSIWWARAAYEWLLVQQVEQWSDPDYEESWDRMKARAEKNGQGYFLPPGSGAMRAPDMANLWAEPPVDEE